MYNQKVFIPGLFKKKLLYLPSIKEMNNPRGLFGLCPIVGNHHDRTAIILVQLMQDLHHLGAHLGIEVTGRLVGQNNLRIADDCPGNSHTLALSR